MKIEDFKCCKTCLHGLRFYCAHPLSSSKSFNACQTKELEYYKPNEKLLKKFYRINNPSLFKRIIIKIFKLQ